MGDAIISDIATKLFDLTITAVGKYLRFVLDYKKNIAALEAQVDKLDAERDDKSYSIEVAQKNTEKIKTQVKRWQDEAGKISGEARQIIKDHKDKGKNRCLMGLFPNLSSRYEFSTKACEKKTEMENAMKEAEKIIKVSDPAIGLGKKIALSMEGLFVFESRKSILEDIMKALQDAATKSIGVYGFGGMGKTTLAKQVAAQADEGSMFEDIVFASVTQKVEFKEIQEKISSMLDLKLMDSTEAEYAGLIHERLKGKRALVILDDLWKDLSLNDLGIPSDCKILLTSRTRSVLTSMGTEKDFNLGALKEGEAWRLFEEKTGSIIKKSDFHTIGKKVVKRCQGLPVLIVTIAASLSKRKELSSWRDALRQLKKMDNKEMHEIVNSAIESISYNHLEKTHKQLFLLCGVFGGDVSVEELFQYSWGFDLFKEEPMTIQEARDRLYTLILDLKESCLLLNDADERNPIKMHDVVRDVAISIARKDLNMFSVREHDIELENIWHKNDVLEKCTAMVLRHCPNLPRLPEHLERPSLELFVIDGTSGDSPPSIPESFFEKTSKLKVLGMSQLSFLGLPQSLLFLENLQTLRVNDCYSLKDISVVGKLNKLQILSFVGSGIQELSSGIGQLSELRSLDLRYCSKLKVIPAGLLEGLTQLEELYVSRDFNRWEAEERVNGSVKTNASLQELKHLHNLCSLEIKVGDGKFLPEDLHFEKLDRYDIVVGDMWDIQSWDLHNLGVTRKFCMQLSTSINHLQHGVKMLFNSTECLWLGELEGFKNVTPALDADGFPNLKHLIIQKDCDIQYIVNVGDKQRKTAFPCLESLHLIHLVKLQKISNSPLMKGSFGNLTTMKVNNCNRLESLFSFSMASGLSKLQEIEVSDCDALEAIVAENNMNEDGVCEEVEFAQLRRLTLKRLPKLKSFFSNGELQNESQKSLSPESHTKDEKEELKSSLPFFTKASYPKLEYLELSGISSFKYLVTPSVAMSLVGLQSLEVFNCDGMEHLVGAEERETDFETIDFPHLSYLSLQYLPNLTTIYSEMDSNENLDTAAQPLFSEKVSFPKLQQLTLCGISNLTDICSHKFLEISCCNLTTLSISGSKSLKHVFLSYTAPFLNNLVDLSISDCEEVETVFGDENHEESPEEIIKATQHEHTFMFTKLTTLRLRKLPKLKCFYPRKHTIECQALAYIKVDDCGKLYTFDFLSFPQKQGDNQFEKVMSNLKSLSIRSIDLMKILTLYDHFPLHIFRSLETLLIFENDGRSVVFPSEFVGIFYNQLQTFCAYNCSIQEIFAYEGEVTNHANDGVPLPQLTTLTLEKLPELKYICKHDQYSPFILNTLDGLQNIQVEECPRVTNLLPPSVSFRSLFVLTVRDCGGLTNLMQPSTARSLSNLFMLTISRCEMMEKVIGDDDEESSRDDDNEFIFNQLDYLQLSKLPRLTTFCTSPNYTFNFPRLSRAVVTECPNMKTFCGGITTTPEQHVLEYGEEEWEGDLNATVQMAFATMEAERLGTSTSSSNHVEASEELIEPVPTVVQIPQNPEKESEVYENSIETETCKAIVLYTRETGKGKEPEISEEVMEHSRKFQETTRHSDTSAHKNYTAQQQTVEGSVPSSSKLSSHSAEFPRLATSLPSTSSNNQEAEIHGKAAENSAEAEKTAELEEGSLASSEETNPPAQTSLSLFTQFEFQTLTSTSLNSQFNPKAEIHVKEAEELPEPTKEDQIRKHVIDELENKTEISEKATFCDSAIESRKGTEIVEETIERGGTHFQELRVTKHFIPLMSKVLEILQTQPLNHMRPEHVQFMEDASSELSHMNFPMEWLCPYLVKAKNCLSVVERTNAISEVELKIAEVEANLQALQESKRAMEEENKVTAFSMDLDKPLYED